MSPSTHYSALGLTPAASAEQIKRAYRLLAKQFHPDVSTAPDAQGKFALIAAAYEVLSDPLKRRAYDDQLAQAALTQRSADLRAHYSWRNVAGAPAPESDEPDPTDLDQMYDTFFGNRTGGKRGKKGNVGGSEDLDGAPPESGAR